ncbi:myb/SANT-like DNA-binding domain-containing protein 1 [Haemaphysalis longicornis]
MATNADDSASSHCGNDRTKWTDDETRAVIRLWQDHLPDLRRAKRNHHVYARISERLVALGIEKTVKEVKKKIENLGNLFRFHNRTGTTTGKGAIKWRFFREINVFLGKLDKNNRELVQESRCGPSAAPAAAAASPVQCLIGFRMNYLNTHCSLATCSSDLTTHPSRLQIGGAMKARCRGL